MGALFSKPKAPPPPPPPPNPQTAAKANESLTGGPPVPGSPGAAGGTLLTSASGAPEVKTGGKQLLGG